MLEQFVNVWLARQGLDAANMTAGQIVAYGQVVAEGFVSQPD